MHWWNLSILCWNFRNFIWHKPSEVPTMSRNTDKLKAKLFDWSTSLFKLLVNLKWIYCLEIKVNCLVLQVPSCLPLFWRLIFSVCSEILQTSWCFNTGSWFKKHLSPAPAATNILREKRGVLFVCLNSWLSICWQEQQKKT